jgi:class 3 adenylate cyclase
MPPETRYARNGDAHVAYQVIGTGPIDLVVIDQWFSNMEAQWEFAPLARLLERLATFARVIVFDKRGTGISDPIALDGHLLEEWMDDLRAVLDDVGSERTALLCGIGAAYMMLLFAATYPERTTALVGVDPCARISWAPDYPLGWPLEGLLQDLERLRSSWGPGGGTMTFLAPNLLQDPAVSASFGRYERQSASPGAAVAMLRMMYESDVRHVLPAVQVPTLVLQKAEAARIPPAHGRYVAEHIAGAKYGEIPGSENYMWAGDTDLLLAEIQEFLTGVRPAPDPDRVLATVLFTDIVGSTERAAELGDRRWRDLLERHNALVRRELERFRGREVDTAGDGFLATFDGPARAIRCAIAIGRSVRELGLEVRAGLHTGEIELIGDDVGGLAVHIGARVAALGGPGEVLVSSTVKDLVVGSGIAFEDRGAHTLKGVPGTWQLFTVGPQSVS